MPPEAPYLWTDAVQLRELPRPLLDKDVAGPSEQARRWRGVAARFLLILVLPTAVAALYFGFLSADRYVSEARLLVHSGNSPPRVKMRKL